MKLNIRNKLLLAFAAVIVLTGVVGFIGYNSANFITGIAKIDQRLVILLDLHRILTNEERFSLQPA